jgi:hypothetical protein
MAPEVCVPPPPPPVDVIEENTELPPAFPTRYEGVTPIAAPPFPTVTVLAPPFTANDPVLYPPAPPPPAIPHPPVAPPAITKYSVANCAAPKLLARSPITLDF